MRLTLFTLVMTCGLLAPSQAPADSIWGRRNFFKAFLFVDTRPRRPGDLVTIVVTENTAITNSDKRDLAKEKKKGLDFSLKGNIAGTSQTALRTTAAAANVAHDLTKEYIGQSAYNSDQNFIDGMTVTVIDVLANGNLVVEGCRLRTVGCEVRTLHVTGMLRPIDIGPGNTISSNYISNLHMEYLGKGPQTNYSSQGWFSRRFYSLWPF